MSQQFSEPLSEQPMPASEGAVGGSQLPERGAEFAKLVRLFAQAGRDGGLRFMPAQFESISESGERLAVSIERLGHMAQRVDAFGHQLVHALDGREGGSDGV